MVVVTQRDDTDRRVVTKLELQLQRHEFHSWQLRSFVANLGKL